MSCIGLWHCIDTAFGDAAASKHPWQDGDTAILSPQCWTNRPSPLKRAATQDGQGPSPVSAKPMGFQQPEPVNLSFWAIIARSILYHAGKHLPALKACKVKAECDLLSGFSPWKC